MFEMPSIVGFGGTAEAGAAARASSSKAMPATATATRVRTRAPASSIDSADAVFPLVLNLSLPVCLGPHGRFRKRLELPLADPIPIPCRDRGTINAPFLGSQVPYPKPQAAVGRRQQRHRVCG